MYRKANGIIFDCHNLSALCLTKLIFSPAFKLGPYKMYFKYCFVHLQGEFLVIERVVVIWNHLSFAASTFGFIWHQRKLEQKAEKDFNVRCVD